ncbi:MAG: hypothetical protein EPO24_02500 [Bacteroidetes bacterium]|nr:MAG: hypothetical protein EPO24_02500 [Bacteroidota bacterium]
MVNVSTGFTDNVMATIGVKDTPSFAWKVLTNLAPLVMATIILLIIAGALYISGAWNNTEFSHAAGITKSSYQVVSTWISQGTHQLNTWLLKIFPFHFTNNGIMLTVFLLCFFSAIGLMDKYLFANLMKRKQP